MVQHVAKQRRSRGVDTGSKQIWNFNRRQFAARFEEWLQMCGILSGLIILAGTAIAYSSRFSRRRRKLLESFGGILFVTGLVLLGFTIPLSY